MNILYANEECLELEKYYSVMLLGPTPRNKETKSWRPNFIEQLKLHDDPYDKTLDNVMILSPECRNDIWLDNYDSQITWEQKHLDLANLLVFWVPRELTHMPAFTTNIEFGMYIMSDKDFIYGRPDNSPKNKYLDFSYEKYRNKKPYGDTSTMIYDIVNNYIKPYNESRY